MWNSDMAPAALNADVLDFGINSLLVFISALNASQDVWWTICIQ